ncbi:MAG: ABC-2 transporter permease [Tissierellia bacterium]|nr:ABC-2 transporter permease [Tissierellia bacterium]
MKGLIVKDFTYIKNYWKTYLLAIILGIIPTALINYDPNFMLIISMLIIFIISINTFSFDKENNWNKYALTMPVSRRDIVRAKYMLNIIGLLLGSILGFLLSLIGNFFYKIDLDFNNFINILIISMAFFLILSAIDLPTLFKWGTNKGKIVLMIVLFTLIAIIFQIIEKAYNYILNISSIDTIKLNLLIILISILIYFISYKISLYIMSKKEY